MQDTEHRAPGRTQRQGDDRSHARWRLQVVRYGRPVPDANATDPDTSIRAPEADISLKQPSGRAAARSCRSPLTRLLAPHTRWRSQGVRYGRPAPASTARQLGASRRAVGTPSAWTWAALMRRVVALDVLACPRCGGRLHVIATVQDPLAVQALLAHLARSHTPAPPAPAGPHVARASAPLATRPLPLVGIPGLSSAPPARRHPSARSVPASVTASPRPSRMDAGPARS